MNVVVRCLGWLRGVASKSNVQLFIAGVVITFDSDFIGLSEVYPDDPGIVFCNKKKNEHSVSQIIHYLLIMHGCMQQEELIGKIEFAP